MTRALSGLSDVGIPFSEGSDLLLMSSPFTPSTTSKVKPVIEDAREIRSSLSVSSGKLSTKTFSNCNFFERQQW